MRLAKIEFTTGDILKSDAEALVNPVNCVGVMGRGLALKFKKAFPQNFEAYKAACDRGEVKPGQMLLCDVVSSPNSKTIINFPTKRHWRAKSRIEDIVSGLEALALVIRQRNISSIAIPALGSGLGGLDWPQVRARIDQALSDIPDLKVIVYEPMA